MWLIVALGIVGIEFGVLISICRVAASAERYSEVVGARARARAYTYRRAPR
jgi:hypothetical protein